MANNGSFVMDRMDGIKKPVQNSAIYDSMNLYLSNPLQLDKICRICLCETTKLRYMFNSNLHNMLNSLGFIQVSEDDGLPSVMCVQCIHRCNKTYAFKHECEKSDIILRKFISPEFQEKLVKHTQRQTMQETQRQMQFSKKNKVKEEVEESMIEFIKKEPELIASSVIKSDPDKRQHMSIKQETPTSETTTSNLDQPATPQIPDIAASLTEKYKYQCQKCDASFTFKVDLNTHIMTHCPFACTVCNRRYITVEKLEAHMKFHTRIKRHQCNTCGATFRKKCDHNKHVMTHSYKLPGAKAKCLVCTKEFKGVSGLSGHQKRFKGHDLFACALCGEQSTKVGHLKTHLRTCDTSNKSCMQKSNLEKQPKRHVGDNPQCCQFCGKESPPHEACMRKIKECEDWIKNQHTDTNIENVEAV